MSDQAATQTEHPVPVRAFIKMLKGTRDEVYSRLLLISHSNQNKTPTAWRDALERHRGLPTAPVAAEAPAFGSVPAISTDEQERT